MKKDSLKISKLRTSGGGGGWVRDLGHLRTRGEGGSKSGQILRTSFMYGPLKCVEEQISNILFSTKKNLCYEPLAFIPNPKTISLTSVICLKT